MLRRVARALRWVLFVLGLVALAWLPVSNWVFSTFAFTHQSREMWIYVTPGSIGVTVFHYPYMSRDRGTSITEIAPFRRRAAVHWTYSALLPSVGALNQGFVLRVPLWLLALLCLAWPVTSFIVARRRRKGRGFEVEAVGTRKMVNEE